MSEFDANFSGASATGLPASRGRIYTRFSYRWMILLRSLVFQSIEVSRRGSLFALFARLPLFRRIPWGFNWRGEYFIARPCDVFAIEEVLLNGEYDFCADIPRCSDENKKMVVVDAGANIGLFSLSVGRQNSNAQIYSIEPDRATCRILRINSRLSGQSCWRVFNKVLWGASGCIAFQSAKSSTSSRVSLDVNSGRRVNMVAATSLADFVKDNQISHIDILKLDIEGAEQGVLEASEAICGIVDNLIVEIHPPASSVEGVMSLLERNFTDVRVIGGRISSKLLVHASRNGKVSPIE